MAEVLGTVVGVISLGIQVSSAIGAYIEGVQCREDDIESTIRYQRSLQVLLTQIGSLNDHLLKSPISNTTALEEALKAANAQIAQLDAFLGKVLVPDHASSSNSASQKFRNSKKKLLFPFRRDQLSSLDKKLESANNALQSAMQVMELEISMVTQASVCKMHEETSTANAVLLGIKTDLDRSISQSQSNAITTRRDMNELKSVVQALASANSDTTLTLQRLISKPDALRVVCEGIVSEGSGQPVFQPNQTSDDKASPEAESFYKSLYCNCNTRRSLKRTLRRSGSAFVMKEVVAEKPHLSSCSLSVSVSVKNKWTAGISAMVLRNLVSVAVTITTSTILGAGGFAISPSITYLPIRNGSPAQQALSLLYTASHYAKAWSDQDFHRLVWRTLKTIQTSFNSRTSSPFDINSNGDTLLHDITATWAYNCPQNQLHEVVKYLVSAGVPRDRPGQWGTYPFQIALQSSLRNSPSMIDLLHTVCPEDTLLALDIQKTGDREPMAPDMDLLVIHMETIIQSSKLAALYSGHPSEAIILRDGPALKHALDRNVSLSDLAAKDALGNNCLNHLLAWPEGLRLVVDRFGPGVFDTPGRTLTLEHALHWSGRTCVGKTSTRCQDRCSCTDALKLMMDSDEECFARVTSRSYWMNYVINTSYRAREMVVERLCKLRQELKAIAVARLAPQEIEKWGLLSTKALDQHTHSVITALNRRGHAIPRKLLTDTYHKDDANRLVSVYHKLGGGLNGVPTAELFYQNGFHDIDLPDSAGYTPIASAWHPNYVAWLIRHGAKLYFHSSGTVAGHVAYTLAKWMSAPVWSEADMDPETFPTIYSALSDYWYLDACICGCSKAGCHPFTSMWTELLDGRSPWRDPVSSQYIQNKVVEICKITAQVSAIGKDSREFKSSCLRACTFELMPVRHTCCSLQMEEECDAEEWREIREEDAFELKRFEILVEEFEAEFFKAPCSLTKFMQTYWSERMVTVLREIADQKLSKEEIDNIEMLGVSLQIEDETSEQHEVQGDPTQLEYWYRQLDALV